MKMNVVVVRQATVVIAASCMAFAVYAQDGSQPNRSEYVEPKVYSAAEAVRDVALSPTSGLVGQFAFIVKGWGCDGRRIFLNSEADYRDPGTLTVALSGPAVAAFTDQLGGSPDDRLSGRTIVANGAARQARITLSENGQPTGQFYFQTHVTVSHADNIYLVPGPALPLVVSPPANASDEVRTDRTACD